jgi:hypothetical protein
MDDEQRKPSPLSIVAVLSLLLLAAYLLLSGPMWVVARDHQIMWAYRLIYAPLIWLTQHIDVIKRAWIEYVNSWT